MAGRREQKSPLPETEERAVVPGDENECSFGELLRDGAPAIPAMFLGLVKMLSTSTRCFVTVRVMHCRAMKLGAMLCGSCAPLRERSMIALAVIEMMVDMSVEVFRSVIPRTRADEYPA